MDESTMLSSRSAAMEALSNLSSAHARLTTSATALVDRLFPGDGLVRDDSILPFVNLAFVAILKARADLDTYAKSFTEVLKTVDAIRAPALNLATEPTPAAPSAAPADSVTQSESVGALKRKYEEGMAANPSSAAPKKGPPSPRSGATAPSPAPVGSPASAKKGPLPPKPASIVKPAPTAPSVAPSAAPATTASTLTSSSSSVVTTPAATPIVITTSAEIAKDGDTLSNSEASSSEPRGASEASPARPIDASKKEAMKKALEDMVLPPRKKPSPPPAGSKSSAGNSSAASNGASLASAGEKRDSVTSADDGRRESSELAAASANSSPDGATPCESAEGGDHNDETSEDRKGADTGTGGTSDDNISSDEEEYLRGVEERRQKAASEKLDRLRSAKEAREARQNMYSFLSNDPPPGFVSPAKPAAGSPSGSGSKSKTKKEKKDKARDKTASSTKSAGVGAAAASTGNSGVANAAVAANAANDESSGRKKASGANNSASAGNGLNASNGADAALGGAAASHVRGPSSDLDLSSSPTSTDATNSHQQNDGSFTTRYRPLTAIDPSTWRRAEEAIVKSNAPPKRRWEEYQTKYAAKLQAADATAKANSKDMPKKQYSTTNLKAGLKTNLQLKGLRATRDRRISHGDAGLTDSPRKRITTLDPSDGSTDSPRRKSNADDSSDGKEPSPLHKKPLPKLDVVDDPRVRLFEAPISDTNLRFMERNGEELIAGGTIEKLIQILTSASDPNPEYFQCFMLTYHNFLTPQKLIELLRLRWNSQPADPAKLDLFVAKHLHSIRLRIVNVLRMWIEKFGTDFKDESVVEALTDFVEYIRAEYPQMADLVTSKLNKYLAGYIFDTEGDVDEDPPESHLILDGKDANPSLTDIHPEEFARQMTLVEHALFKAIPYKELLTNATAGKLNPNVSNMISYTNHLVNWIGTQIVKHEDIKMRAIALARFITIGKYCIISCQNYNGAMEVLSALRAAPVFRMKHTWNLLPDNIWEDYEWLENIFESDNNYAAYRAALTNAVPPCVPYLGRYLSEILFLNELHPDYLDHTQHGNSPVINFAKMTYVADILLHMQRYQKSPFCLTGAPSIQKFFLLKRGVLGDKDLYKLSLEREPREASSSVSSATHTPSPSLTSSDTSLPVS